MIVVILSAGKDLLSFIGNNCRRKHDHLGAMKRNSHRVTIPQAYNNQSFARLRMTNRRSAQDTKAEER
jgi:hypothetical protein